LPSKFFFPKFRQNFLLRKIRIPKKNFGGKKINLAKKVSPFVIDKLFEFIDRLVGGSNPSRVRKIAKNGRSCIHDFSIKISIIANNMHCNSIGSHWNK
jgi:hypothetical protein